jgi:hypothetical protein
VRFKQLLAKHESRMTHARRVRRYRAKGLHASIIYRSRTAQIRSDRMRQQCFTNITICSEQGGSAKTRKQQSPPDRLDHVLLIGFKSMPQNFLLNFIIES